MLYVNVESSELWGAAELKDDLDRELEDSSRPRKSS